MLPPGQFDSWASYRGGGWQVINAQMKVQASVARCLRTPPQPAKAEDFDFGLSRRIKQREQPEHSCRWQLYIGPVTTVPSRAKAHPLRPRRSYFTPMAGISVGGRVVR